MPSLLVLAVLTINTWISFVLLFASAFGLNAFPLPLFTMARRASKTSWLDVALTVIVAVPDEDVMIVFPLSVALHTAVDCQLVSAKPTISTKAVSIVRVEEPRSYTPGRSRIV